MTGDGFSLPATGVAQRSAWIDVMRVLAVFLVVFEHAVMFAPVPVSPWIVDLSNLFAPFRIPALMFLSGLLLPKSLAKGPGQYLQGKLLNIVWPYFVWSILIWGLANFGDDRPNLWFELFVNPTTTPMWFLAYLALYYVVALLIPTRLAVFVIPASLIIGALPPIPENLQRLLYLLAFFLAGDVIARHSDRLLPLFFRRSVTVVSLAIGVALAIGSLNGLSIKYEPLYAVPVFASLIAVLPFMAAVSRTKFGQFLARFGGDTIVLFVIHWPAQVYTWNLLARLGVSNGVVFVLGNLIVALFAGYVAVWLRRRSEIVGWLFALPRPRPKRLATLR